jgi:hypothetical protein
VLADEIKHLRKNPYTSIGIFPNYLARHPFEGDYILRVVEPGRIPVRVLYIVDRSEMMITVVAVRQQVGSEI